MPLGRDKRDRREDKRAYESHDKVHSYGYGRYEGGGQVRIFRKAVKTEGHFCKVILIIYNWNLYGTGSADIKDIE